MKKSIASKWVKALKSGEYAQGKGKLVKQGKKYDRFCCLGVLTDLYMQEVGDLEVDGEDSEELYYGFCYDEALHPSVQKWAGMKSFSGDYGCAYSLAQRNDEGDKFEELADIIETNWKKL